MTSALLDHDEMLTSMAQMLASMTLRDWAMYGAVPGAATLLVMVMTARKLFDFR